jgi:hypothetical protein
MLFPVGGTPTREKEIKNPAFQNGIIYDLKIVTPVGVSPTGMYKNGR